MKTHFDVLTFISSCSSMLLLNYCLLHQIGNKTFNIFAFIFVKWMRDVTIKMRKYNKTKRNKYSLCMYDRKMEKNAESRHVMTHVHFKAMRK